MPNQKESKSRFYTFFEKIFEKIKSRNEKIETNKTASSAKSDLSYTKAISNPKFIHFANSFTYFHNFCGLMSEKIKENSYVNFVGNGVVKQMIVLCKNAYDAGKQANLENTKFNKLNEDQLVNQSWQTVKKLISLNETLDEIFKWLEIKNSLPDDEEKNRHQMSGQNITTKTIISLINDFKTSLGKINVEDYETNLIKNYQYIAENYLYHKGYSFP